MAIQNPTPITIPASTQEVYDSFWATRMIINSPDPNGKAAAFIELKPYNATTKKTLNETRRVSINDLWDAAEKKPEVAAAINSILTAINTIINSN